jgi:heat shock protein HslJ
MKPLTALATSVIMIGGVALADSPTGNVVVSDLQHHRWILESINGEPIPTDGEDGMIPELDIGEQMQVTGNSGCNRMFGKAELRDGYFQIPVLAGTRRLCSPASNELEITVQGVLGQLSEITLDADKSLTLATDTIVLRFRLRDWVD